MASSQRHMLLTVALLLGGCAPGPLPPEPQLLLHVVTDAPLPPSSGAQVAPDKPAPLFDRLRFDLYAKGAASPCAGCGRTFALDHEMVDEGRASIGIFAADGDVARIRIYRSDTQLSDFPTPVSTVEAWVGVPSLDEDDGVVHRWVMLPTDAVAQPLGARDAPIDPKEGTPPSGLVGSWPHAAHVDCADAAGPGEVCVPGGAFWMAPQRAATSIDNGAAAQRLVVLPPFFMHTTEVTVGEFRAQDVALPGDPQQYSGTPDWNDRADWCTFTQAPSERDVLPLNCVTWARARAYCESVGGTLPSEAQHEYVAGGLRSAVYVWGTDDPDCGDAVFGGQSEELIDVTLGSGNGFVGPCAEGDSGGAPLPVDRADHGRDVFVVGGSPIYDLAGNLKELTRDRFEAEGLCRSTGVVFDPHCPFDVSDPNTPVVQKGGGWRTRASFMRAAFRISARQIGSVDRGFRCVRAATPAP
jgi:sulfatase modifying factor 1